jgi:CubicO group peptidase (beta-lactamase class C family)
MTTAIDFSENYTGGSDTMKRYSNATGFIARRGDYDGPDSIYSFLPTISKQGMHGDAFTYRTPNTDVVAWLIARVTGQSPATVLSERIWRRIGAEADAFMQVDAQGTVLAGLSLNTRLRDLARFGELMRCDGFYNGAQIIPAAVVQDIRRGGSREAFAKATYPTLPGWSYRNQWWIAHDAHGAFMARGIHGQAIYIDPKAEMTIARYASNHLAGNTLIDPLSLPAYRAMADHLIRHA